MNPPACTAPPCHDPIVFGHRPWCRLGPRSDEERRLADDSRRRQKILMYYSPWLPPAPLGPVTLGGVI